MANPIRPVGLDHVVLWVRDLPRATAWYRDVLGCAPAWDFPGLGMAHLWFGGIVIGLWDRDHPGAAYALRPEGTNMDHLALAVGPFDMAALEAHLAAHGVAVEARVEQVGARGLGRSVYVRDPWDNRLEIKGPVERFEDR